MGKTLAQDIRLTYLFPGECVEKKWLAWLPRYTDGRGLVWRREDDASDPEDSGIEDRVFRRRLVTSRASTAIDPRSDAAADGSLRETECVADRWRHSGTRIGTRVAMIGYAFVREGAQFSPTQGSIVHIGGDVRYGLGRLTCASFAKDERVFGRMVDRERENPRIFSSNVLAHAAAPLDDDGEPHGAFETLSGWNQDQGRLAALDEGRPLWAPGSWWTRELRWELRWEITSYGIWKLSSSTG